MHAASDMAEIETRMQQEADAAIAVDMAIAEEEAAERLRLADEALAAGGNEVVEVVMHGDGDEGDGAEANAAADGAEPGADDDLLQYMDEEEQ